MHPEFEIQFSNWEGSIFGSPEVSGTAAELSITFGSKVATRAEDYRARTTRNDILVSAYPLALWFASNWWRLRWETATGGLNQRPTSWRMAHELPAAGFGFLWPSITFASDGDIVDIECRISDPEPHEPIQFLAEFQSRITVESFERTIDSLVAMVLARLNAIGAVDSVLGPLWQAVLEERREPALAFGREIEARLGYDPDEAPDGLVERLLEESEKIGAGAVSEIASAIISQDPVRVFARILEQVNTAGVQGRIDPKIQTGKSLDRLRSTSHPPWERGRQLAAMLRATWGLNGGAVPSEMLAEILNISQQHLHEPNSEVPRDMPIGLMVRTDQQDRSQFIFRRRNRFGRRFEAARFVGDWMLADESERWLPATDAATTRQKVQRAFAAEFLCPIESLRGFLGEDYSEDALEDASHHFDVSTRTVESHLVNHRLLSRMAVDWDDNAPG